MTRTFRILTLAALLPLAVSCGLVENIKQSINDTISQLTAVSQGNLKSLVDSSSTSAKSVSEQLSSLKGEAAKPAQSTRFELGKRTAEKMTLIPLQDDAACPAITRAKDDDGNRTLTSDYSGCSDEDGRSGIIKATLEETDAKRTLTVTFEDYVEGNETKNGTSSWEIKYLSDFTTVEVDANDQLEVVVLRDTGLGVPLPVTVTSSLNISYEINPEAQTLEIDGSGNFTQNSRTATLSYADVLFDFSESGCERGPKSGSIAMKNDQDGEFKIEVTDCGTATQTNADGSTESPSGAELDDLFSNSLKALGTFFTKLNGVVVDEQQILQCDASKIEQDKTEPNNSASAATTVAFDANAGGVIRGSQVFGDEDWFSTTLPSSGTYAFEAIPKSADALWPFVCVYDTNGNIISQSPGGAPGSLAPAQGDDFVPAGCAPGFVDVEVSGEKQVRVQVMDPFEEYACQGYTLAMYDVNSDFTPPSLPEFDGSSGGGDCPLSWIGDGLCDLGCVPVWGPDSENPDTGDVNGDDDGGDCAEGSGSTSCPLFWIGDGVCDNACISTWGSSAKNPETGVQNGSDDGGDCSGSGGTGGGTCPDDTEENNDTLATGTLVKYAGVTAYTGGDWHSYIDGWIALDLNDVDVFELDLSSGFSYDFRALNLSSPQMPRVGVTIKVFNSGGTELDSGSDGTLLGFTPGSSGTYKIRISKSSYSCQPYDLEILESCIAC